MKEDKLELREPFIVNARLHTDGFAETLSVLLGAVF